MAAEAAAEGGRRYFRFAHDSRLTRRLRRSRSRTRSARRSNLRCPTGTAKPTRLTSRDPVGQAAIARSPGFASVPPSPRSEFDRDALVVAAADEPEDSIAVQLGRGPDAAAAEDAAVAVDEELRVRGVQLALREHVGVLRRGDAEPVGQRLQLARAALLAEHAKVVALDEEHVDQVASQLSQLLGVVLDEHPRRDRLGACRLRTPVDAHGADAAATGGREVLHPTQARDVDPVVLCGLQDRLARTSLDLATVDVQRDRFAHDRTFDSSAGDGWRPVRRRAASVERRMSKPGCRPSTDSVRRAS